MNRPGKATFYAQILFWAFVSFYGGRTQVTLTSDDVLSTAGLIVYHIFNWAQGREGLS